MVLISGVLKGPYGDSRSGVTITMRSLTAPRPEGRGFPLQRSEPKPRDAIQDLQALRGLTLPARQL